MKLHLLTMFVFSCSVVAWHLGYLYCIGRGCVMENHKFCAKFFLQCFDSVVTWQLWRAPGGLNVIQFKTSLWCKCVMANDVILHSQVAWGKWHSVMVMDKPMVRVRNSHLYAFTVRALLGFRGILVLFRTISSAQHHRCVNSQGSWGNPKLHVPIQSVKISQAI